MGKMKKYLPIFSFFTFAITHINCDGEIVIMRQPDNLKFYDDKPVYSSELKYMFGTCMGYLWARSTEWQDIHMIHPFDYNKVIIVVAEVPGVKTLDLPAELTIPLIEDEPLEETFKQLNMKTTTIFTDYILKSKSKRIILEKVDLSESDIVSSPLLDSTYKMFDIIHHELQQEKIHSGATLYWAVYPQFNETDQEFFDTGRILTHRTLGTFFEAVKDRFYPLIVLITHDNKISMARRKRQVDTSEAPLPNAYFPTLKSLNLADNYDEDFPVIFNIMLWFSVTLLFSLIAICLVIASMNPGRDSIIYRMTNMRMKKDN